MTPEARSIVAALLRELEAVMAMGAPGKRIGHALGCSQGVWSGPATIPDGLPCSSRCQNTQAAIRVARRWLADHADGDAEQMTMGAM